MKKIALVTGGNRGIGKEVCRQLLEKDFIVLLAARNKESGQKVVDELSGDCHFLQLDVNSEDSVDVAAKWVQIKFGRLDVLVNNAGVFGSKGLADIDMKEFQSIMDTNFYGPARVNKAFIPLLRKSGDARIINVSSGMGALTDMGSDSVAYRLSKAGLNVQSIILAKELSGTAIRVNSACPGWVKTDMGGTSAPRSVDKGAETIVWLSTEKEIPNGKFVRDKKVIDF